MFVAFLYKLMSSCYQTKAVDVVELDAERSVSKPDVQNGGTHLSCHFCSKEPPCSTWTDRPGIYVIWI